MGTRAVVEIQDLWKRFVVRHNRTESLKQLFIGWLDFRRRERKEAFWALEAISLEVGPGEMVGIIGPNGSGKSTLLRLIAGILHQEKGWIRVRGRVAPMIELGVGFHPELTGEENVYLNASLYGLSRDEVRSIFADIVRFAELENFIDVPIKNYSMGMYMRLGFSVAVHLKPDILLVDEVLAVGDGSFQKKCLQRMRELKAEGVSILFVSHSMDLVQELCDRVYIIYRGRLDFQGNSSEAVKHYLATISRAPEGGQV